MEKEDRPMANSPNVHYVDFLDHNEKKFSGMLSDEQLKNEAILKNGLNGLPIKTPMDDEERPQQESTKSEEPVNNDHNNASKQLQANPKSNSNEEHLNNNDHERNKEPLLPVTMPKNGNKKEPLNGDRGSQDSGSNNSHWNKIKSGYSNGKDRVVNHIKEHPLRSLGPVTCLLLVALLVIIILLCVKFWGGNTEDANTTPIPATTPLPNETDYDD